MHRSQPNRLHDELDALLDGRPVELTDELVPLVEAADVLLVELATHELDPEVADRHLARVLEGSTAVVALPERRSSVLEALEPESDAVRVEARGPLDEAPWT